jgi:hypothetical protein
MRALQADLAHEGKLLRHICWDPKRRAFAPNIGTGSRHNGRDSAHIRYSKSLARTVPKIESRKVGEGERWVIMTANKSQCQNANSRSRSGLTQLEW